MSAAVSEPAASAKTCPSAPPETGSVLLGVVAERGRIAYLTPHVPVTPALLDGMARQNVPIENRLRFAGPCMQGRCEQWRGAQGAGRCSLIDRTIEALGGEGGRGGAAALRDTAELPLV
jgi:hypothetical protein